MQAETFDLQDLVWAPDNSVILCLDTSLEVDNNLFIIGFTKFLLV